MEAHAVDVEGRDLALGQPARTGVADAHVGPVLERAQHDRDRVLARGTWGAPGYRSRRGLRNRTRSGPPASLPERRDLLALRRVPRPVAREPAVLRFIRAAPRLPPAPGDLDNRWLDSLTCLLSDPAKSPVWLFMDDSQNVYGSKLDVREEYRPFELTVNCRNTRAIHREVVKKYIGSVVPEVLGPEGRAPELVHCEDQAPAVAEALERLCGREEILTQDVVVLSSQRSAASFARAPSTTSSPSSARSVPSSSRSISTRKCVAGLAASARSRESVPTSIGAGRLGSCPVGRSPCGVVDDRRGRPPSGRGFPRRARSSARSVDDSLSRASFTSPERSWST